MAPADRPGRRSGLPGSISVTRPASPLSGVRVLDLTRVMMGPLATHILADLGADVIKIEDAAGDSTRHYRPLRHPGMAGSFLNLNRNKRSVQLDLKQDAGREALRRLIPSADVFVHSMRPNAIKRLGFDYPAVKSLSPEIVYCAGQGYGSGGRYRDKAAYDDVIQAGSGIAALFGMMGGEPAYMPTVICDKLCGHTMAWSILAALLHRERGGGGQAIEVPMLETSIEFLMMDHMVGSAFEPPLAPTGYARLLTRHRRPFATRDGYMCILPYSDANWRDMFDFIGRPDLRDDERFHHISGRTDHIDMLYGVIADAAPNFDNAEWQTFCDKASIACTAVKGLDEVREDPHVRDVKLFSVEQHPSEGAYQAIRSPVSFSEAPFAIRHHAPRLGEHTVEVLAEIGMSAAENGGSVANDR
ncbi:MAG: CaiB/BaiF CoA transferase family protein [Janthinobacterium lividum]